MRAIFIFLLFLATTLALDTCKKKRFPAGIVCVCDENYCDKLYAPESKSNDEFLWVKSSHSGDRFAHQYGKIRAAPSPESLCNTSKVLINIDSTRTYQKILGFGGGFTGAVTVIVKALPQKLKEFLYKSYYSKTFGMGYDYTRITIGSCDFDVEKWAYNEHPEHDFLLSNFTSIDPRDLDRNRELKEVARIAKNPNIKLIAAAWSAPKWMKMTPKWTGGYDSQIWPWWYQTWADYHIKWLDVMFKSGTPVWAITTGNEPATSCQTKFISQYWDTAEHAKWIAEHLGPALAKSKYSHVQLHGFDDLRDKLIDYVNGVEKANKKAFDFIKAFDFHAYTDVETPAQLLSVLHAKYPTKPILYTEMCWGVKDTTLLKGPRIGFWPRAIGQTDTIIRNFNNFMSAYLDWNLIVGKRGGPNTQDNVVDAAIIASPDYKQIYKQPLFYSLAHFAKFISPGSVRIHWDTKPSPVIQTTAFLRPDGKIVIIVQNSDYVKEHDVIINDLKKGSFTIKTEPLSINTIVYSSKCI